MSAIIDVGSPLQVDKQDVARSFSQAAATYDQVAALQRQVAATLLTKIPAKVFPTVVDLGCGTGAITTQLAQRCQAETLLGLDIAEGMLAFARQRWPQAELLWCGGDAESLPLQDASIDLMFSSLAVQWCADFPRVCDEAMRVLKPGGYCVLATLGPDTLCELRSAWHHVDGYVHVNRFLDADMVTQAASNAGFACQLWREDIVMRYPQLRQLTAELKALGAHNVNSGRPKGLTGRQRIEKLKAGYEPFRNAEGLLPATYEVYYLLLEKPA